jgi:uncharacterized membrane protein YfcA
MEVVGLIILGLVAGSLASTLGLGGGVVFVPVLVSVFAFSQHEAQGTSLAIIVPTALVAAMAHARAGRVVWRLVAIVGTVGVAGAIGGARVALILDEEVLRRLFSVILIVVAVRMGLRARSLLALRGVGDDSHSVDGS